MCTFAYIMMQDRLSTGGSFILCDGNANGFPISYASAGFCDLFGYPAAECKGVKCGDLVADKSILANDPELERTAKIAGLSPEAVRAGLSLMTAYTGNECKQIMEEAGKVSFSLVLNRRKNGELFVNELVMMTHRYPSLGWSYFVGFQRDISGEIPLTQLLQAASSRQDYLALVHKRDVHVVEHVRRLGVQGDDAVQYLHEKASEAWVDKFLMSQVLQDNADGKLRFAPLPASLCSTEPGASGDSESSASCSVIGEGPSPAAAPRALPDGSGVADTARLIVGHWHGVVSKELGGHEQSLEFAGDGCSAQITIFGKVIDGSYKLDCSTEPHKLTLLLPVPTFTEAGGPQVHPIVCIVTLKDDVLHFCQAHDSAEFPTAFAGSGYCALRRVQPQSDASTDLPKSSVRSIGMSSKSSHTAEDISDTGNTLRIVGDCRRVERLPLAALALGLGVVSAGALLLWRRRNLSFSR
jgi:hypothetical protein